jgi:hypothetical protein
VINLTLSPKPKTAHTREKNMNKRFFSGLYYIVDYLVEGIQQRHVFKLLDAANGVVFDDVPDREGWVWGQRSTGQVVEMALDSIVMLAEYDVHWRNNQGSGRNSSWSEEQVSNHLANCPADRNGVVETPLTRITDSSGNDAHRTEIEREPEPEPKVKQGWLW